MFKNRLEVLEEVKRNCLDETFSEHLIRPNDTIKWLGKNALGYFKYPKGYKLIDRVLEYFDEVGGHISSWIGVIPVNGGNVLYVRFH